MQTSHVAVTHPLRSRTPRGWLATASLESGRSDPQIGDQYPANTRDGETGFLSSFSHRPCGLVFELLESETAVRSAEVQLARWDEKGLRSWEPEVPPPPFLGCGVLGA